MSEGKYNDVDFDSIFDKNLDVGEYTEKLEELLRKSRIGIVEKRKLIRQKVQEFKDAKRKPTGWQKKEEE